MKAKIIINLFFVFLYACVSQQDRYEHVSVHLRAIQDELKALVKLEVALRGHDYQKAMYDEMYYRKIRQRNRKAGIWVGPDLPKNLGPQQKIAVVEQNFHVVSDRVRSLEKKTQKNHNSGIIQSETHKYVCSYNKPNNINRVLAIPIIPIRMPASSILRFSASRLGQSKGRSLRPFHTTQGPIKIPNPYIKATKPR